MHPSVRAAFLNFTRPLEGVFDYMYTDVLGLVTTGVGNLIDSVPAAMALAWRVRGMDVAALPNEVANEWHAVKDGKIPAWHGPRSIYLRDEDILALVDLRLQQNESYLAMRWSNWDQWTADAQLGAHSCSWAAGSGWRAPKFDAAVNALDFAIAAGPDGDANLDPQYRGESWLNDGFPGKVTRPGPPGANPGLRPRNLANKALFSNAARVVQFGFERSTLHWPTELS